MRVGISIGLAMALVFGLIVVAPGASAATCVLPDVKCCTLNEKGVMLARCLSCEAIGGYWNTDTDQCAIP